MKLDIPGNCPIAVSLRQDFTAAGYVIGEWGLKVIRIDIRFHDELALVIDGVDSLLEVKMLKHVAEQVRRDIVLRLGGHGENQNDSRAIVILVPRTDEQLHAQVEMGIFCGVEDFNRHARHEFEAPPTSPPQVQTDQAQWMGATLIPPQIGGFLKQALPYILMALLLGLFFIFGYIAHADGQVPGRVDLSRLGGTSVPGGLVDGNGIKVQCVSGCAGGGSVTSNQGTALSQSGRWPVFLSNGSIEWGLVGTPFGVRLSDGAAFYDGAKTGQLPAALVSGRLDVNVGNVPAVSQSGTWNIATLTGITNSVNVNTHAVSQSGTWNVGTLTTLTGITNPVAVTGTFFQATQPVSGTVTANQGGTWTVQPGNVANTTAWKVDGSAVTSPVSLVSVPSHNVTNAGTFAVQSVESGIWTVQPGNTANTTAWLVTGSGGTFPASQSGTWTMQPGNVANTTAWKVDGSAVTQPVSGTITANAGSGTFTVSGTVTANQGGSPWGANQTQLNSVALGSPSNYGTSPGAVSVPGVNAFVTNTVAVNNTQQGTASQNVSQFGGTNISTGAGAGGAGIPRVTISSDSSLAANQSVNINQVAGSAIAAAATGVQKVGVSGNAGAAFDAANNAAVPANVIAAGLEAVSQGTQPTAAASGNIRRQLASTEGVTFVQEGNSNRFSCFVQAVTVTTQCQPAPAAGLRAYITSAHFSNQAATVQTLDIVFGTGSNCATGITALTHKWQMGTNATTTSPQAIEASFQTPLIPTAANAICVRPSAASSFGATITGYIAP